MVNNKSLKEFSTKWSVIWRYFLEVSPLSYATVTLITFMHGGVCKSEIQVRADSQLTPQGKVLHKYINMESNDKAAYE